MAKGDRGQFDLHIKNSYLGIGTVGTLLVVLCAVSCAES